jgi:uncharacterized membrane protein YebE (DUF533 family)
MIYMNAQDLLNEILASGKKLLEQGGELASQGKAVAQQGVEYARENFSLPEAGPERERMLTHLGAGAAAGGILAMLLATRRGRSTLKTGAKIGSLAALGALGYKIYTEHQKQMGNSDLVLAESQLNEADQNPRCLMIVRAMISAAKADGVIDETEQKMIEDRIRDSSLDAGTIDGLLEEIQKPTNPHDLAGMVSTPIDAIDIYLASLMVVDEPNQKEQEYLSQLATALELEEGLVQRIQGEAFRPV